jgi:hypothetical protein
MTERHLRRPVIDPLLMALKSRRVIVALSALVVSVLVMAEPRLVPIRQEMLTLVVTLSLAIIGGYTVEEAVRAGRERAEIPNEKLRQLIKDLLAELIDELAHDTGTEQGQPKEETHVGT